MRKAIRLFAIPALAISVVGVACAVNAAIAHNQLSALWIDKPDCIGRWLFLALVVVGLALATVDCVKRRWSAAALRLLGVLLSCLAFVAVVEAGRIGGRIVDGPCDLSVRVLSDGRFSVDGRTMSQDEMREFSLRYYCWSENFNRHARRWRGSILPNIQFMSASLEFLGSCGQPPCVTLSVEGDPPFGNVNCVIGRAFAVRDGDETLRYSELWEHEYIRCPTEPSVFSEAWSRVVIGMDIDENGEPRDWWYYDHSAIYYENEAIKKGASPIIRERYLTPEMVEKSAGAFILSVDAHCPMSKFVAMLRRLKNADYTWIFVLR